MGSVFIRTRVTLGSKLGHGYVWFMERVISRVMSRSGAVGSHTLDHVVTMLELPIWSWA